MNESRPGRSKLRSGNHGVNVAGGLSVENTVNQTVNHILTQSPEDLRLDAQTYEYFLKREIDHAVRPYADEMRRQQDTVQRREAEVARQRDRAEQAETRLRQAMEVVKRRRIHRHLLLGAMAAAVALGILLGFRFDREASTTPVAGAAEPVSSSSEQRLADEQQAELLVREYFDRGGENDSSEMWQIATSNYQEESGSWEEFDQFWGDEVQDVEALISPGSRPVIDSGADDSEIWVQVAWRYRESSAASLHKKEYFVAWFKTVRIDSEYYIDEREPGVPNTCPPRGWMTCTAQDSFNPSALAD